MLMQHHAYWVVALLAIEVVDEGVAAADRHAGGEPATKEHMACDARGRSRAYISYSLLPHSPANDELCGSDPVQQVVHGLVMNDIHSHLEEQCG